jgi:hypothetical protein
VGADRYPEAHSGGLVSPGEAREGRPGDELGQGTHCVALEGQSPREHPAAGVLNTRLAARDSRKGQSPGAAARRAGLVLRHRVYWREKRHVGPLGGKPPGTFREEKAPKGESHERRRYETRPARDRREETVKRVAKP